MNQLGLIFSALLLTFLHPAKPQLILFGRGLYPGDDSTYATIRTSGYNTVVLSSFYIRANGDVYSGDSPTPIIHDGEYTGDKEWAKRIASLKKGARVEFLLEGRWYNQPPNTFDFIRHWADSTAHGLDDTLYRICKIFKEQLGADALCIDDESVYDSSSIIRLGTLLQRLGMHMTLCPFRHESYWKAVLDGSAAQKDLIDGVYLQCYDGGTGNTPGPWVKSLGGGVPVYPIFLCRGSFGTCGASHGSEPVDSIRIMMGDFKKEYPGLNGGAIWQMADIKNYVQMGCAPVTVTGYLEQLKEALKGGIEAAPYK
jgi:hypothetical protein